MSRPDIARERAKAIWAFQPGQLVDALWEFLADRRACHVADPGGILTDLEELLAGDEPPARPSPDARAQTRTAAS